MEAEMLSRLQEHAAETKRRLRDRHARGDAAHLSQTQKRRAIKQARAALKNVAIFHGISQKDLRKMTRKMRMTKFRSGELLIKQGAVGTHCYILVTGSVGIYVQKKNRRLHVTTLKSGSVIGERSMLFDKMTSADCVALEPCQCAFLTRQAFDESVSEDIVGKLQA